MGDWYRERATKNGLSLFLCENVRAYVKFNLFYLLFDFVCVCFFTVCLCVSVSLCCSNQLHTVVFIIYVRVSHIGVSKMFI